MSQSNLIAIWNPEGAESSRLSGSTDGGDFEGGGMMHHNQKLLHAKQIAKYLAEQGATVSESEKILEMSLDVVKASVVNVQCVDKFEGWM